MSPVQQHHPVVADPDLHTVHGVLHPCRALEPPATRTVQHLRRLRRGLTTPFGAGCTYIAVARTERIDEPRTDIGPLDQNSTFPIEEFMWQFDPYFSTPTVLGHKVTL